MWNTFSQMELCSAWCAVEQRIYYGTLFRVVICRTQVSLCNPDQCGGILEHMMAYGAQLKVFGCGTQGSLWNFSLCGGLWNMGYPIEPDQRGGRETQCRLCNLVQGGGL